MIIGKKIFLVPEHRIKRIPYWVKRLRPSAIAATPGHFKEMLTSKYLKNTEVSFIKFLLCGGDFFDVKDIERVNNFLAAGGSEVKIINGYGMTEVASGAVQLDLQNYHPDSIGSCLPLVSVKVVKEGTQTEVEDGQEGEVCLYTPCQTEGYYKNPEATEKLLKKHADGREWIHTGDVGYIGENGCLYLKGRIKRMVVTQSGTKIFLNQLEEAINRIEGVQKSAAVMIQSPDDGYSKYLFLYVVLKERGFVSRSRVMKKIKQLCYSELPQYLVPDYIRLCKKLEQTPSGKISYTILEKKSEEQLKHRLVKRYYTLR